MANKRITIDDLAGMVQKGFNGVDKNFKNTASKTDVLNLEKKMDKRFDKVEKILIEKQNRKIERLESRVDYLENILSLPKLSDSKK